LLVKAANEPCLKGVCTSAAVSFKERGAVPAPEKGAVTAKRVFTLDEVKSLNAFQRAGVAHPYTCVYGRDRNHLDGEGVLVATERGWICLYCDYTQDWAHGFMKDWSWKEMFWRELEGMRRERR